MPLLNPEGPLMGQPLGFAGLPCTKLVSSQDPVTEVSVGTSQARAEYLKERGPVISPSAPVRGNP